MKRFIAIICLSLLLVGCSTSLNTPTGAVEDFLSRYQNLDSRVLTQLEKVLEDDDSMNKEQKEEYKKLMLNQYKNLSYKVNDENIMDDEAEVEVELEVLDYASSISQSRIYYKRHLDEFDGSDSSDDIDNIGSFIDYKIKNMKNVNNTTKYEMTFYLEKQDNEWVVNDISNNDILKIHGLYEG